MDKIDPEEYEKRVARITSLFSDIVRHSETQSLTRCPYKNKDDRCTASFGCRYKSPIKSDESLPQCDSDDLLDYRSAWDTHPESYEKMRQQLQETILNPDDPRITSAGTVSTVHKTLPAKVGKTLFDYADDFQLSVPSSCGRMGQCHECIIEITEGMESLCPKAETEAFLSESFRLACQSSVQHSDKNICFSVLSRSPQILTATQTATLDRDPTVIRKGNDVYYQDELIDQFRGGIFGLAIDLGTSTIVMELVNLQSCEAIYTCSFENPQRFGGSDVMNRISYDAGPFRGKLHRVLINTLNDKIFHIAEQTQIDRRMIYEIVLVGNPTMRDLFFNLDVQSIGQRPYKSSMEHAFLEGKRTTTAITSLTRKLRLAVNKNARVFGAPIIASHVGGDIVADLVTLDLAVQTGTVMLVDVGTNTEVVLKSGNRMVTASCPAGPAFEGGLVTFGMPGYEGAIESITYQEDQLTYQTIGDVKPTGICGSGLIDLLATLRRSEQMTPMGVFADKAQAFTVVPEPRITLSREDASHLAQAKAANYCGQYILMRSLGVTPESIDKLYLAGGFANYVDPESAIAIGFLAPVDTERIVKVGNSASQGAKELLLSQKKRQDIEKVIAQIEHIELETTADFFEIFVDGCQFKPMQFV